MENTGDWEPKALCNELIEGKELVKQLRSHLDRSSPAGELLIEMLLSSYDRVISMANKSGCDPQAAGLGTNLLESPRSKSESPRSDDSGPSDLSKRRKTLLPKWTEKLGVGSAGTSTGIEGPPDDGYSWRKYGQKAILGATYPRAYYRCTYKKTQGCPAKRQVQRSSNNPAIFDVTYEGSHICLQVSHLIPVSHFRMNQNQNKNQKQEEQEEQEEQKPKLSQEVLLNFETGLRIKTEDDILETQRLDLPSSTSFSFPSTSTPRTECTTIDNNHNFSSSNSNYLAYFHGNMNCIGGALHNFHTIESADFTEIISATTSATDSPIVDMDFSLESVNLNPNFSFPDFFN